MICRELIRKTFKNLYPPPDKCAEKFPLVSIWGRVECQVCTDMGTRTPIGASRKSLSVIYQLHMCHTSATFYTHLCHISFTSKPHVILISVTGILHHYQPSLQKVSQVSSTYHQHIINISSTYRPHTVNILSKYHPQVIFILFRPKLFGLVQFQNLSLR